MQEDIRYIKAPENDFIVKGAQQLVSPFWGIHILGLLILLGLAGFEYRSNQLQGNADLRRSVQAMQQARKRLKHTRKLAEDSPELRSQLHQCIIGFIGARLQVAENALDIAGVKSLLEQHAVPEDLIGETEAFLHGLTMDRFAPGAVQRSAAEWIDVTHKLLQRLGRTL